MDSDRNSLEGEDADRVIKTTSVERYIFAPTYSVDQGSARQLPPQLPGTAAIERRNRRKGTREKDEELQENSDTAYEVDNEQHQKPDRRFATVSIYILCVR